MKEIKIGWLFKDTLYLHGERGNIVALLDIAKAAGVEATFETIDFATKDFDPENYDILFCPPGEIVSFPPVVEWLKPYENKLKAFIEAGKPLIVTGTSMGIFCKKIKRTSGEEFDGLGILDAEVLERESVYGDDLFYTCEYNGKSFEIIGCQIQLADFASETEKPFGNLHYGYGNTGKDTKEGFAKKNSIFTNTLDPIFAVHPSLGLEVIRVAAENKGIELSDVSYDFELEKKSLETKKEFLKGKATKLTNCQKIGE